VSTFDPAYILELADLADPNQLWQLAGIDQLDLPDNKRRQLDAGVCLRRHASHLQDLIEAKAQGKSMLITPLSPNSSASTLVDTPKRHLKLLKDRQ